MTDDLVEIIDNDTLEILDTCHGPVGGRCPGSDERGVVACAGRRIAPVDAGPEYQMLWIPPNSQHCPLTWNLEAVGM